MCAWRELSHSEVDARNLLLPVNTQLHLSGEGVDVQLERLDGDFVGTRFLECLLQVAASLVGSVAGIASPLVLGGGELLDHPLVRGHVLRIGLHADKRQQKNH